MRWIRPGVAVVSLMTPIGETGMNDTECAGYWQGASSSWHQTHVTYSVRRSPWRRSYWSGATNLIKTKHTLIATNDAAQSRVAIWRPLVAQCGFWLETDFVTPATVGLCQSPKSKIVNMPLIGNNSIRLCITMNASWIKNKNVPKYICIQGKAQKL